MAVFEVKVVGVKVSITLQEALVTIWSSELSDGRGDISQKQNTQQELGECIPPPIWTFLAAPNRTWQMKS